MVLISVSNDLGSAMSTCSTTSASVQTCPMQANSLSSSFRYSRNSVMEAPSSIFRFVSFLLSSSFLEFVLLADRSLRAFQQTSGSVMLAMYGITLSFTDKAMIVNVLFFCNWSAAISAGVVGAIVPVDIAATWAVGHP